MRRDDSGDAIGLQWEGPAVSLPESPPARLPWIEISPSGCYFQTETGEPWTPIGQNDAISWTEFESLFRRRNPGAVEAHLLWLKAHGVTCLRLMLEYSQVRHRYFEQPIGRFPPNMVRLWDDLFALCEKHGIRILLTPFDTFWMWLHWKWHPYNRMNGGCLDTPARILLSREARHAIKARMTFAVTRWGGSGALFAWDLWNEIHPAQAEDSADCFGEFISDISAHVRTLEKQLYGRAHLQTVSLFGPELRWRPHMPLEAPIFRHPDLDFATLHIYEEGTIDDPRDTVAPAIGTGRIVRDALARIRDGRPFLDSEHGPIHAFKDKHITLPEPFDDEYFRHMQWAHFASGAAGGGMRWPNRRPHVLTAGMRRAQRALADFLPLIDWNGFRRRCLNDEIEVACGDVACFGCGDDRQALLWLLRRDTIGADGTLDRGATPIAPEVSVPGLSAGRYRLTAWDTSGGIATGSQELDHAGGKLRFSTPAFAADVALAITPL